MAGREEQKRREWHVEQAVSTAKRDLAVKVYKTLDRFRGPDVRKADIMLVIQRLFIEEGIDVGKEPNT